MRRYEGVQPSVSAAASSESLDAASSDSVEVSYLDWISSVGS